MLTFLFKDIDKNNIVPTIMKQMDNLIIHHNKFIDW